MPEKFEVWVVRISSDNSSALLIEKTDDKEILKETMANIRTLAPSKWSKCSQKWSKRDADVVMVDIPYDGDKCDG